MKTVLRRVKAEKLYYTALIGYIWYECVEEEQNFTTLLDMINASEAREDAKEELGKYAKMA